MGCVADEESVHPHLLRFNEKDDSVLFTDPNMRKICVRPGEFIVFFPPFGAHAPGQTEMEPHIIRKMVIKVKV